MKKKIFGGIALLAIAAVAAWNVNLDAKNNDLSAPSLTDIEAAADCEVTKGGSVKLSCSGSGSCSTTYLGYTLTCDGSKN
jgi:hypothetical protein